MFKLSLATCVWSDVRSHEILMVDLGKHQALRPVDRSHHLGRSAEKDRDGGYWLAMGLCLSNLICLNLSFSRNKMGIVMSVAHGRLCELCRVAGLVRGA